jgi:hypothetical protein
VTIIVHCSLFVLAVYSMLSVDNADRLRTSAGSRFLYLHVPNLTTFTAAKANDLAVLLQLSNELIALLDNVVVSRDSQ